MGALDGDELPKDLDRSINWASSDGGGARAVKAIEPILRKSWVPPDVYFPAFLKMLKSLLSFLGAKELWPNEDISEARAVSLR